MTKKKTKRERDPWDKERAYRDAGSGSDGHRVPRWCINLPSASSKEGRTERTSEDVDRRTRRRGCEERVDKKGIVSVGVSEVACPGASLRRSQCKRGRRLHRWRCGSASQRQHPATTAAQLGKPPAAARERVYECSPRRIYAGSWRRL